MLHLETASSVWKIDEDQRRFLRLPKNEDPRNHPNGVSYELRWQEYEEFQIAEEPKQNGTVFGWPFRVILAEPNEWGDDRLSSTAIKIGRG